MTEDTTKITISSALTALLASALFYLAASSKGTYVQTDMYGGAIYTFLLSLIVALSIYSRK